MTDIDPRLRELLAAPNVVHLATLTAQGAPHAVAIWAEMQGDRVAFFTSDPESFKARNIRRDPRVAISVTDRHNPYLTAWIRGRVVDTVQGDAALEVMDRLANVYTGEPFPMRTGIAFLIEIDRAKVSELPFIPVPGDLPGPR